MPKFLTHWILAEEAAGRMPADWMLRRAVEGAPKLFRFGAIAPDTPFHLIWGPGSRRLNRHAEGLHEKGERLERFLASPGSRISADEVEKRMAFGAGIISHAAADAVFHPMVYYFSGAGTAAARIRHHRLEGFIDLFFSHNLSRPRERRLGRLLDNLEIETGTLIDWLSRLFGLDPRRHRRHLHRALVLNVFFQALFVSRAARLAAAGAFPAAPEGLRAYLAHFYPYPLPDRQRLFRRPIGYRNPAGGEMDQARIEDLAAAAVDLALSVLAGLEKGERRISVLFPGGWNLHTGIGARPKAAMAHFDTRRPVERIAGL